MGLVTYVLEEDNRTARKYEGDIISVGPNIERTIYWRRDNEKTEITRGSFNEANPTSLKQSFVFTNYSHSIWKKKKGK